MVICHAAMGNQYTFSATTVVVKEAKVDATYTVGCVMAEELLTLTNPNLLQWDKSK